MPLFAVKDQKLTLIKEEKITLERDIQRLTEQNLGEVFGLEFVKSEFALNNLRIDTLAFDQETKSFVIIEYKRDRSFSVVDQGFSYLALMLNNKADFILEYNENRKQQMKRDDVDWSQSRVIFVANSFTTYQKEAINFKDLPIELWEAKKYAGGMMLFNQVKASRAVESINKISKSETVEKVSREVKSYTVDDHFKDTWSASREIFDQLRERVLALDAQLVESPQKYYIGYKLGSSLVLDLKIYKMGVSLELPRVQPSDLKDPDSRVQYLKDSFKFWNKHVSYYVVKSPDDIDYAIFLAKQVYDKFYK